MKDMVKSLVGTLLTILVIVTCTIWVIKDLKESCNHFCDRAGAMSVKYVDRHTCECLSYSQTNSILLIDRSVLPDPKHPPFVPKKDPPGIRVSGTITMELKTDDLPEPREPLFF